MNARTLRARLVLAMQAAATAVGVSGPTGCAGPRDPVAERHRFVSRTITTVQTIDAIRLAHTTRDQAGRIDDASCAALCAPPHDDDRLEGCVIATFSPESLHRPLVCVSTGPNNYNGGKTDVQTTTATAEEIARAIADPAACKETCFNMGGSLACHAGAMPSPAAQLLVCGYVMSSGWGSGSGSDWFKINIPSGRATDTLESPSRDASDRSLGAHFAARAEAEAASIVAFRILAKELRAFGAPASLVRQAHRSARDEARHARAMARYARTHGGRPRRLRFAQYRVRSLETFARENAIEGCVGETIGAAIALHQAAHGRDVALRATMDRIARDELRHAALAFRVHAWVEGRLDRDGRARVRAAARDAVAQARLRPPFMESPAREALGLPDRATAAALVDAACAAALSASKLERGR